MGCCLSKDNDFSNTPPPPFPPPTHFQVPESDPHPAKAPLSPVFEEESVKEVLSEIPKPKPQPQPLSIPDEPKQSTLLQEDIKKPTTVIPSVSKVEEDDKRERKVEVVNHNAVASPEISEVSEICSLSESISTTTLTERREEEDGEVVQQRVHRSPAKALRKRSIPGDFMGKHERGSKSPARRLNPSPGRRNGNDHTSSEVNHTARRRMSSENPRVKRDPNERSGRRSRSPATRVNSGVGGNRPGSSGRSPSRKAPPPPSRSPARVPPPPAAAANERKVVEEEETKEGNGSTNESIENPLVSLECFIFL